MQSIAVCPLCCIELGASILTAHEIGRVYIIIVIEDGLSQPFCSFGDVCAVSCGLDAEVGLQQHCGCQERQADAEAFGKLVAFMSFREVVKDHLFHCLPPRI